MVEKISIEVGWFTLFLVVIWFLLIEKIFVDKMRNVKLVLPCVWTGTPPCFLGPPFNGHHNKGHLVMFYFSKPAN